MFISHILAFTIDKPHNKSVHALNIVARPGRLPMVAEKQRCVL